MNDDSVQVLVVASWPAVRAGLRAMLDGVDGIRVAGEVTLAGLASGLLSNVDAYVIDLDDDPATVTAIEEALAAAPAVLLASEPDDYRGLAEQEGPRAYLLRQAGGEEIAAAVHAVLRGLVVFDPVVARVLRGALPSPVRVDSPELAETLTDRELEVLRELALGLPNKAIALRLGISDHTVKFHVGAILAKLGAAGRTEAVMIAARRGLLPL